MLPSLVNKKSIPTDVVASRDEAFAEAAAAVKSAVAAASAASAVHDAEIASAAETERERAALAHPGVDEAAIRTYRERLADLAIKSEGHQQRLAASEAARAAEGAAVADAKAKFASAKADLDAPLIDDMASLPALRSAAQADTAKAEQASAALDRAKQEGAPALAAFSALDDGAEKEDARRILKARREALAKIDAARALSDEAAETANVTRARLRALEARQDRDQREATLHKRRQRLEDQRAALTAAIGGFNEVGAQMGGLVAAGGVYVKAFARAVSIAAGGHVEGHDRWLTLNPAFAESAFVPILGDKNGGAFVSSNWRHDYARFEQPQKLLQPLLAALRAKGAEWAACRRAALDAFDAEYQRLGGRLLEPHAVLHLWLVEREAAFAEAGDIARGVAKPEWPLQSTMGGDFLPWRRLSLPALRPGGAPLWEPHWPGERLLEVTRSAKAA